MDEQGPSRRGRVEALENRCIVEPAGRGRQASDGVDWGRAMSMGISKP